MRIFIIFLSLFTGSLLFIGCESERRVIRVTTTGSHAPQADMSKPAKPVRFVVWGNHPGMVAQIIDILVRGGQTVVERARLQEVLSEQKIRLTHTPDDDAEILRVGRLLGADRLVFAEATIRPEVWNNTVVTPQFGGASGSGTIYHLSVMVRAVNAETGEVRWNGAAQYTRPVNEPDNGIVLLTKAAVSRATCPIELGYVWKEDDGIEGTKLGCRKPNSAED